MDICLLMRDGKYVTEKQKDIYLVHSKVSYVQINPPV